MALAVLAENRYAGTCAGEAVAGTFMMALMHFTRSAACNPMTWLEVDCRARVILRAREILQSDQFLGGCARLAPILAALIQTAPQFSHARKVSHDRALEFLHPFLSPPS
jgi:hypothetical protein